MDHDFYSVFEAAEDLGCTENDLLKLGINGTIDLYIWYEGQYQSPYDGEVHGVRKFIAISDADIMRVYQEHTGSPRLFTVNQKADSVVTLKNVEQLPEASFKTVDLDIFPVVTSLFLMSATLDALKTEHQKPMELAEAAPIESGIDKLTPSEKKSLLKMIFAMAVDCYGYDPQDKRSPISTDISAAAAKADVSITDDTIRKWLKEGARLRNSEL